MFGLFGEQQGRLADEDLQPPALHENVLACLCCDDQEPRYQQKPSLLMAQVIPVAEHFRGSGYRDASVDRTSDGEGVV
jgi:hypothetical protein